MEKKEILFESNYKKLGFLDFNENDLARLNGDFFQSYIKVLHLPENTEIMVDFKTYFIQQPSLFFINANQIFNISKLGNGSAQFIFYNRDFYCVQIHDAEVACDGLLFNNIFEIPKVELQSFDKSLISDLLQQIIEELLLKDNTSEEMIRIHLKEIIIRATRLWKKQNVENNVPNIQANELNFFRDFSRLVEIHFREKHSVSDYAKLMYLAPKTLSSKFHKMKLENPNEIIKNRIVLEAKRLLIFTDLSVKEIGYQLGYDDPAYFNRLFTQKVKTSPAGFRKENLS